MKKGRQPWHGRISIRYATLFEKHVLLSIVTIVMAIWKKCTKTRWHIDGTMLGEYFDDLFVEDCLIIELKACKTIADEHVAQILGYLRSSRMENGLLIKFGSSKLYVKKYIMSVKQVEGEGSAIEPG